MPNCSFCNAQLEKVDVETGHCPVCGKPSTARDTEDGLSTLKMESSDENADFEGSVSDTGPLATMIVEIPAGEGERLGEEEFIGDSGTIGCAEQSPEDLSGTDSIDESEQMATMPMEPGDADDAEGADSIDVAESADTYLFEGDDESAGDRAGGSEQDTQQTMLSDEISDDGSYEQTLVSDDLPDDVLQTMKLAWVSADQPDVTPGMTVKAEEEALKKAETPVPETSLVIKLRRLIEADEAGTAEAEYELVQLLGEGGMGVVYLARQTSIDRLVAIKMMKPKTAKSQDQQLKFLAEAVVTGDLDHPNIVPIYDVGNNDSGALFYSMKRVEGTPWLDVIKQKTLEENLDIFDSVANAVSFAHARGVVHRDLKPENVMLGGYGEVLLMDWGLAQPTKEFGKKGSIAETRSMGGTPAYMAPEMATGPLRKIGPHSDIYLLGAILFEIVTGKPPHRGANAMKCLMSAAKNEIRPVEETGELMDIAMQAMSTDAADRYTVVKDFQHAIKEYLSHTESVDLSTRADKELSQAEESDVYQDYARCLFGFQEAYALWNGNERAEEGISETRLAYAGSAMRKGDFDLGVSLLDVELPEHATLHAKLVKSKEEVESRARALKRMKKAGVISALVFIAVVSGLGIWANNERNNADVARADAEDKTKMAVKAQKEANKAKDDAVEAREEETKAKDDAVEAKNEAVVARDDAQKARDQSDKDKIVAQKAEAEAKRQTEIAELNGYKELYGGYLANIGLAKAKIDENAFDAARTLLEDPKYDEFHNWEWGRLMYLCSQEQRRFEASGSNVLAIDVSRDGTRLVTASNGGKVEVWDLENAGKENGKPLLMIDVAAAGINVNAVAISPDGNKIVTGTSAKTGRLKLWDIKTAEELRTFGDSNGKHKAAILSVRFSYDGRWLVSGSEDNKARIWNTETGEHLAVLQGHHWWVWDAAFSPNGKQIVTAGQDGFAIVWTDNTRDPKQRWTDPASIRQGAKFTGHTGPVYSAAFSPDGTEVITGGYDRRVLVWDPQKVAPYEWENLKRSYESDRAGSDREKMAAFSLNLPVDVWQQLKKSLKKRGANGEDLLNQMKLLVGDVLVTPPASYRALDGHTGSVRSVRVFRNTNSETESVAKRGASYGDKNSQEELLILSSGDDGTVKVWNAATGTAIRTFRNSDQAGNTFRGHGSWVRTCAFAPDGKSVFSGSGDGTAKQWNISEYAEIQELTGRKFTGHADAVLSASFSFANRQILTASQDRTAKTWSEDGHELRTFREGHEYLTSHALFFPDGEKMLTAAVDNTVRIWNVAAGTEQHTLEHTGRSAAVALSGDGRWVLTGSDKPDDEIDLWSAKLWNAETGDLVLEIKDDDLNDRTPSAEVTAVAFSPADDKTFYIGDQSGRGRLWRLDVDSEGKVTVKKLHRLDPPKPIENTKPTIVSARFLDDGSRVLTASADYTVAQWDVETGKEYTKLSLPHGDSLTAIDVSTIVTGSGEKQEKQSVVLTSCADGTVRLWNADTAKEIGRLEIEGSVAALARNLTEILKRNLLNQNDLLNDSGLTKEDLSDILSPTSLDEPKNFDATVLALSRVLKVDRADLLEPYINAVALSADGRRALTTNAEEGIVRLWDLQTLEEIPIPNGPYENQSFLDSNRVSSLESAIFSSTDKENSREQFVLTVGRTDAQLWDAETGVEHVQYRPHGLVSAAGYSRDDKYVVTAGSEWTARIWNVETGKTVVNLTGHTKAVNSALFSPDGKWVLTASDDGTARIWDVADGSELMQFGKPGVTAAVKQAVFSPDEDGTYVLTASDDNIARIWDAKTGEQLAELNKHTDAVFCVAFSPDGTRVITGSRDTSAKIWALEFAEDGTVTGARVILNLPGHTAAVTSVAFSPDRKELKLEQETVFLTGSRALTGSEDYIVKLWDTWTDDDIELLAEAKREAEASRKAMEAKQAEDQAAEQQPEAPVDAAADPDNGADPQAAVAGDKNDADADVPDATEILSLAGHDREVTAVAFSPDGTQILTSGKDGKAILWLTVAWKTDDKTRQTASNVTASQVTLWRRFPRVR